MEHEETSQTVVTEEVTESEHTKMDVNLADLKTVLENNGLGNDKAGFQWNNPLIWLIILGFLRGDNGGGLFGGGSGDAGTAAALASQGAKLDCLQQGQHDATIASLRAEMVNLNHQTTIANNEGFNRLASALAECCCNLRTGQKEILCGQESIKNALCQQTGIITTAITTGNQRIIDVVNAHANEENRDKLNDCKQDLSNCRQTNAFAEQLALLTKEIREACNNGHGRRSVEAT